MTQGCPLEARGYDGEQLLDVRGRVVVDVVAARDMIEQKAIAFQELNDFTRFNGGELRHTRVRAMQLTIRPQSELAPCAS
jgi:hypothetical protein